MHGKSGIYLDANQHGDDLTTRGFTQHEHLNGFDLIHMNGRAYDYNLGRFLSVDPIIQFPENSQSLNPYSYIMNNPMSGTDPTGYACSTGTRISEACGSFSPFASVPVNGGDDSRRGSGDNGNAKRQYHIVGEGSGKIKTPEDIKALGRNDIEQVMIAKGKDGTELIEIDLGGTTGKRYGSNSGNGTIPGVLSRPVGDESDQNSIGAVEAVISGASAVASVVPRGTVGFTAVSKEFRFYEWANNGRYINNQYLTTLRLHTASTVKGIGAVGVVINLAANRDGLFAGDISAYADVGVTIYTTFALHPVAGFVVGPAFRYRNEGAAYIVEGLIRGQDQGAFHRTSKQSDNLTRSLEKSIKAWEK